MENSAFVSDSELLYYVNASYQELYDLVLQSYEDYFVTSTTFTISSGSTYSIPATFYKLKGLDLLLGSDYVNLEPYSWSGRNVNALHRSRTDLRYRLVGDNIQIVPEDNAVGSYRLWYVPVVTELVSASDTINTNLSRMGWDDYIAIDCAIKMREKEESDTSGLERMKARMIARIVASSANRDSGSPGQISDVRGGTDGDIWFI
jgi:hypothetical protein